MVVHIFPHLLFTLTNGAGMALRYLRLKKPSTFWTNWQKTEPELCQCLLT
jgi:hypothetical protein